MRRSLGHGSPGLLRDGTIVGNVTVDPFYRGANRTHLGSPLPAIVDDARPTDVDCDGRYEDLNGNDRLDFQDLVVYFIHLEDSSITSHPFAYDFNHNGRIDYDDLVTLFEKI